MSNKKTNKAPVPEYVPGELIEVEALPAVELTEASRYRKLSLCVLALVAVHLVQWSADKPVTWPVVAVDALVVLGYVSANVLIKWILSGSAKRAASPPAVPAAGLGALEDLLRKAVGNG